MSTWPEFLEMFFFKDLKTQWNIHVFLKTTIQDMRYESSRLYFIPACPWSGSTTKKVVSGRCVSWFEVTLVVQQKRRCHAKGGGYCQHHQLSNHMGQAAPGSKGGTTDDNMSQCNLPTSESLGPDTCAFLL